MNNWDASGEWILIRSFLVPLPSRIKMLKSSRETFHDCNPNAEISQAQSVNIRFVCYLLVFTALAWAETKIVLSRLRVSDGYPFQRPR